MKATKNMTNGNIYQNFLLYAIPLLLSSLLTQAYPLVDAVIAGKFISEFALGAISSTSSYEIVFSSFFNGFAAGFSIYIAHLFGKKELSSIKRDVTNMSIFIFTISVVISAVSIVLRDPIMDYLKIDPILRRNAEIYFIIYTASYAFSLVNLLLIQTLYALGITSFSLYTSILSTVLNIVGNLLAVAVFDWGVAGLAFSTVLSSAVNTLLLVWMIRRVFKGFPNQEAPSKFSFSSIRNSLRYTVPAAIQQVAFHGVGLVLAPLINALGAAATTGYTVCNRIYNLGTLSIWSVTSAFNCYTAQCAGEGNYRNIKRGIRVGFCMNCVMFLPVALLFSILASPISGLFFPAGYTGEAFDCAVRYTSIYFSFVFLQMVEHMIHSYIRCLGQITVVFYITIFGSSVRILATFLLVPLMHIDGVFIGQIISWGADAIVSVILYSTLYRKREQIERILSRNRI